MLLQCHIVGIYQFTELYSFFKVKAFHYTIFKNHTIKSPSITRGFKCLEHKETGKYFPEFQFSLESLNVIIGGKVRFFSLEGQGYWSFLNFVEMTPKCPGIPISLFFSSKNCFQ